MCGIAGVCSTDKNAIDPQRLRQAIDRLSHRGPDGSGFWNDAKGIAALGHARLAIIDLPGGSQPLTNEDGQVAVAFNGEIYNHKTLRKELTARGHRFQTACDTEVLVHLYEDFGPAMVERLNGMFAFAIWDARNRRLFLARDRLGQKPLFFAKVPGGVAFASEIKSLAALIETPLRLDPNAVDCYLTFQYVPGDMCAFRGVEKLQPGETLLFSPETGEVCRQKFWTPPTADDERAHFTGTYEEAARELRRLLVDATRLRLMSDVPLGALLSGGIDSSIVVGLMREAGAANLRTFTAKFHDGPDESPFARQIADRFATDHCVLEIQPPDEALLADVLDLYDEPFADTSAPATYLICQQARQHVTVALTGDGADESLLGYSRYVHFADYLKQRKWLRPLMQFSGLRAVSKRLCPNPTRRTWRRRLRTLATLWDPAPDEVYLRWLAAFHGPARDRLLRPEFLQQLDDPGDEPLSRVRNGLNALTGNGDWVSAAAAFDLRTYLPDAVLTKVDRASMAVGLECRSPFLDYRVVEFLSGLPREWKLHPKHGSKRILRDACRDLLPDDVYNRGKTGFGSPVGRWFRNAWQDRIKEYCVPSHGLEEWLDVGFVREMIDEHQSGRVDHSYRLWTLASLNRVAERRT